jgi:hypothetical protein
LRLGSPIKGVHRTYCWYIFLRGLRAWTCTKFLRTPVTGPKSIKRKPRIATNGRSGC